ncbi:hypothetical protein [Nocardiopsis sp. LOL_012]|uniref:hypothetical protein n=1 Tax=Nocardiopsis sp. LOL_012 TaxID=3345409 RepID=UPI003A89F136
MPSREHEIPLRIIQNLPEMVPVLLKESLGIDPPPHTETVLTSSVLTNCDPKEWNSDGAVLLRDGTEHVLAVVVERQHRADARKKSSWPAYLVTLYARLGCPAILLVLCPTDGMACTCAEEIHIGHPGFVLSPLVIGPSATPVVTEAGKARALPELAVLSARAHGDTDPKTLDALMEALDSIDPDRRAFYYDYVMAGLGEAALKHMEDLMAVDTWEWQSDFARKYVGIGREEGRKEGREEVRAEVHDALVDGVIAVLEGRGLPVSDRVRERIASCADLSTLQKWLPKAAGVDRPEDLFD